MTTSSNPLQSFIGHQMNFSLAFISVSCLSHHILFFLLRLLWQLTPFQSRPPSNPLALHTLLFLIVTGFVATPEIRLDLIPTSPTCNNAHVFPSCWVRRHQPTQSFFLIRAIAIVSRYHCLSITLPVSSLFFRSRHDMIPQYKTIV